MRLFFHYAVTEFSNTYLLGSDEGSDAILIDPGKFDTRLLKLIEDNGFYVKHVLVTHSHRTHVEGLRTLLKIYDATIYGSGTDVLGFPCKNISDGETLNLAGLPVEVIGLPGHSSDSLLFKIEDTLFTGDSIEAGIIGSTPNTYLDAQLKDNLQKKLLSREGNLFMFPGHGPPTTLESERLFNSAFPHEV